MYHIFVIVCIIMSYYLYIIWQLEKWLSVLVIFLCILYLYPQHMASFADGMGMYPWPQFVLLPLCPLQSGAVCHKEKVLTQQVRRYAGLPFTSRASKGSGKTNPWSLFLTAFLGSHIHLLSPVDME